MNNLKRFRIWFSVVFLAHFIWPSVKMDFVQITAYPDKPYELAKLLGLSPWAYWLKVEFAMQHESALMLDTLGFYTQPKNKELDTFKAGVELIRVISDHYKRELLSPFRHIHY